MKMELYLKAGADGQSVGDCPFAHYVRWLIVVFFVADDDLGQSLGVSPICPLSLSVYKGYILALIGSDE